MTYRFGTRILREGSDREAPLVDDAQLEVLFQLGDGLRPAPSAVPAHAIVAFAQSGSAGQRSAVAEFRRKRQ